MLGSILADPLLTGVGGAVLVITVGGAWKVVAILAAKRNGRAAPLSPTPPVLIPRNGNGACSARDGVCRQHGERLASLETSNTAFAKDLREVRTDVKCIDRNVGRLLVLSEKQNGGP